MKVFKVYGKSVYVNGEKMSIENIKNSIFCDYKKDFGGPVDNLLIVIEDESERKFIVGTSLADVIEPVRVPYSLCI